jgi:transposase
MVLDGHSAASVCQRLGLTGPNLLYNWVRKLVAQEGTTAVGLEARGREREAELERVEQERDVFKKALAIFGRGG